MYNNWCDEAVENDYWEYTLYTLSIAFIELFWVLMTLFAVKFAVEEKTRALEVAHITAKSASYFEPSVKQSLDLNWTDFRRHMEDLVSDCKVRLVSNDINCSEMGSDSFNYS